MAWSWLQSASNQNAGGGAGSTVAATYGTNLTAGSKLIAVTVASSTTAFVFGFSGVADGSGNNLTLLKGIVDTADDTIIGLWAMDCPAGDAGTKPTLTATWSAPGGDASFGSAILIQEVSGLLAGNTTAMLDGSVATNSGNSNSATTGAYSSTASNEYLMQIYGDPGTGLAISSPPPGTADTANSLGQSTANVAVYYKNSSNGAESATFGLSGSNLWVTMLVAFQLGGPPVTSGPSLGGQSLVRPPVVIVSNSGWRNAAHSR